MGKEGSPLAADPLAPRRRLGLELRRLRESSGLYLDEAAEHLQCSTAKLSRLENGLGVPKVDDIRALLDFYRVRNAEVYDKIIRWAEQGRGKQWWHELSGSWPQDFEKLISFEAEATAIKIFQTRVFPGLLQTPQYAHYVLERYRPHESHEQIASLTNIRIQRQEYWLARENPAKVVAVIDESVLHRSVGSPDILREQINYLIELSKSSLCEIKINPFSVGVNAGDESDFMIYEGTSSQKAVFIDIPGGTKPIKSKSETESYNRSFDLIRSRCLDEDSSRDLLLSAANNFAA